MKCMERTDGNPEIIGFRIPSLGFNDGVAFISFILCPSE